MISQLFNDQFKWFNNSLINSVGDTIGTLLGWLSAYGIDKIGNYYNLYELHIK